MWERMLHIWLSSTTHIIMNHCRWIWDGYLNMHKRYWMLTYFGELSALAMHYEHRKIDIRSHTIREVCYWISSLWSLNGKERNASHIDNDSVVDHMLQASPRNWDDLAAGRFLKFERYTVVALNCLFRSLNSVWAVLSHVIFQIQSYRVARHIKYRSCGSERSTERCMQNKSNNKVAYYQKEYVITG